MQITLFESGEPVGRNRLDSNSVARLDEAGGFTDRFDALEALSATYPGAELLCTLDDLDQCAYTSMHATGRLEDDHNLAVDRDDLAIAGIPNGYFTVDWNIFAGADERGPVRNGRAHLRIVQCPNNFGRKITSRARRGGGAGGFLRR
ncbi:hypothetical protein ACFWUP_08660 [Nocardia sp. NPDC058658]|uniref:hypothetical protein n=1 Tax=Nocardia sp. NPDC058658 TaxID=3346580 RepID=UPI0036658500